MVDYFVKVSGHSKMAPSIMLRRVFVGIFLISLATSQPEDGEIQTCACDTEGWVSREDFEKVKEHLQVVKEELEAKLETVRSEVDILIGRYLTSNPDVWSKECLSSVEELKEEVRNITIQANKQQTSNVAILQGCLEDLKMGIITAVQNITQRAGTSTDQKVNAIRDEIEELKGILVSNFTSGSFQNPAPSCKYIAQESPSGRYWIQSATTGYASLEYCDMTRRCCSSTGGWMRVADFDMTNPNQVCPSGFSLISQPKRLCTRSHKPGCTSITYSVSGTEYQRVCGRATAYQFKTTDAFNAYYYNRAITIDGVYVDGISITHGQFPRKHIWTFAAAYNADHASDSTCPCTRTDIQYTGAVPPFIQNKYFCETGASRGVSSSHNFPYDPLWDGQGCGLTSSCCTFNNPPWFCNELPQPTTDNIEVRVCTNQANSDEDVPFEKIELYIQ